MKLKQLFVAALAAGGVSMAWAQADGTSAPSADADKVCSKRPKPQLPVFSGSVKYSVLVQVRDGKVVGVDIVTLQSTDLSKRDDRSLKMAIMQSVQTYGCEPGINAAFKETVEMRSN